MQCWESILRSYRCLFILLTFQYALCFVGNVIFVKLVCLLLWFSALYFSELCADVPLESLIRKKKKKKKTTCDTVIFYVNAV